MSLTSEELEATSVIALFRTVEVRQRLEESEKDVGTGREQEPYDVVNSNRPVRFPTSTLGATGQRSCIPELMRINDQSSGVLLTRSTPPRTGVCRGAEATQVP